MVSREVVLRVFKNLDIAGYQFVGSCNVKGHAADCMFFEEVKHAFVCIVRCFYLRLLTFRLLQNMFQGHETPRVHDYAMVALTSVNGILFTNVSPAVILAVREGINKYWTPGIHSERTLPYKDVTYMTD